MTRTLLFNTHFSQIRYQIKANTLRHIAKQTQLFLCFLGEFIYIKNKQTNKQKQKQQQHKIENTMVSHQSQVNPSISDSSGTGKVEAHDAHLGPIAYSYLSPLAQPLP